MLDDLRLKEMIMPKNRSKPLLKPVILILISGLFFACSSDDPETVQPTLTSLWNAHFSGCSQNCHEPTGSQSTGPDMRTKASFLAGLKGITVNSTYSTWALTKAADCNDLELINDDAGVADNAAVSTVAGAMIQSVATGIEGSNACNTAYSTHTSNGNAITDATTQQALIDWINNGAQDN